MSIDNYSKKNWAISFEKIVTSFIISIQYLEIYIKRGFKGCLLKLYFFAFVGLRNKFITFLCAPFDGDDRYVLDCIAYIFQMRVNSFLSKEISTLETYLMFCFDLRLTLYNLWAFSMCKCVATAHNKWAKFVTKNDVQIFHSWIRNRNLKTFKV